MRNRNRTQTKPRFLIVTYQSISSQYRTEIFYVRNMINFLHLSYLRGMLGKGRESLAWSVISFAGVGKSQYSNSTVLPLYGQQLRPVPITYRHAIQMPEMILAHFHPPTSPPLPHILPVDQHQVGLAELAGAAEVPALGGIEGLEAHPPVPAVDEVDGAPARVRDRDVEGRAGGAAPRARPAGDAVEAVGPAGLGEAHPGDLHGLAQGLVHHGGHAGAVLVPVHFEKDRLGHPRALLHPPPPLTPRAPGGQARRPRRAWGGRGRAGRPPPPPRTSPGGA